MKSEEDGVPGIGAEGYVGEKISGEICHSRKVRTWEFCYLERVGKEICCWVVVESLVGCGIFCLCHPKVVMRVSKVENAHERHHMAKCNGQSGRQQ